MARRLAPTSGTRAREESFRKASNEALLAQVRLLEGLGLGSQLVEVDEAPLGREGLLGSLLVGTQLELVIAALRLPFDGLASRLPTLSEPWPAKYSDGVGSLAAWGQPPFDSSAARLPTLSEP